MDGIPSAHPVENQSMQEHARPHSILFYTHTFNINAPLLPSHLVHATSFANELARQYFSFVVSLGYDHHPSDIKLPLHDDLCKLKICGLQNKFNQGGYTSQA